MTDHLKNIGYLLNDAIVNRKFTRVIFFLLALNALLIAPFMFANGMIVPSDTTTYDNWSNLFLQNGFAGILRNNSFFVSKLFYLFHLLYICVLKVLVGSQWIKVHFWGNIVAQVITGVLIFFNSYRLTKNAGAALLSNILFYCSVEYSGITACVLSDTNFILLVNLLFFAFLSFTGRKRMIWISVLLLLICFYRPTGAIVVGVAGLCFVIHSMKIRISVKGILAFLAVTFIAILAANSYVLSRGADYIGGTPFRFLESKFGFDLKGVVVWDRYFIKPDFYHHPINAAAFYIEKLMRFFQFIAPGFSIRHIVCNLIFFGVSYFSLVYVIAKQKLTDPRVAAIVLFVFFTAFFHSFTIVDFDWRYRLVLVPFFCNLFAIALNAYQKRKVPGSTVGATS